MACVNDNLNENPALQKVVTDGMVSNTYVAAWVKLLPIQTWEWHSLQSPAIQKE
ncbi:hypothetical protein BaRGS_00017548, partial [Batillaria attramentaria]